MELRRLIFAGTTSLFVLLVVGPTNLRAQRPNVLLICVDDLRPQLGCYGHPQMVTPSLDRFASTARLFTRHYVQVPTCGASRFAMLSGRYPRAGASLGNQAFNLLHADLTKRPTMPEWFQRNGYRTIGLGKVSHQPDGHIRAKESAENDEALLEIPVGWDEVGMPVGKWGDPWSAFFGYANGKGRRVGESPPFEAADVDELGYPDGLLADAAIGRLADMANRGQPFFMAVGFFKPHLPLNSPKSYWDLYDRSTIQLPAWREPPLGVDASISLHRSGELFGNYGMHPENARTSDEYARQLIHGYYAATSYTDAQIGRVLATVDRLGLSQNTVVIIWGDHGWHLGEHGIWAKHTLHDVALKSTLIVRVPHQPEPGVPSPAIVESIDLLPTLIELCQLDSDGLRAEELDGQSVAATIQDPRVPHKSAALGFWRKGPLHGYTMKTMQARATVWTRERNGPVVQREIYDHQIDPNETKNVASADAPMFDELDRRLGQIWEDATERE